jgi:hypothetical protein
MRSYANDLALARLRHAGEGDAPVPVERSHEEDLDVLRDVLRAALELESRCDFADPPKGEQRNRESFLAHFADLQDALEEWDSEVERARSAPGELWDWYARTAAARGIDEPLFAVGPLIDRLATWTVQRARNGQLDTPHELYLQHFKDAFEGEEHVSVYVEGQKVAKLPGDAHGNLQRRTEAADRLIQALFDDAQMCGEAKQIGHARDTLCDLKHELLDRLELQASLTPVLFASGCPFCERSFEPRAGA